MIMGAFLVCNQGETDRNRHGPPKLGIHNPKTFNNECWLAPVSNTGL